MDKKKLKRIYELIFCAVIALFVSFYFLAGDAFIYRDSRFNIVSLEGNSATEELDNGVKITQSFFNKIDRLKSISFKITTFYRTNSGTLNVSLYDGKELLINKKYDVSELEEGQYITLESPEYLEGLTGKELTIVITASSAVGKGVALLMNAGSDAGLYFKVNNVYKAGSLDFKVSGQEYIFTGQVYWYISIAVSLLVGVMLLISYRRFLNNRLDYFSIGIKAIEKYKFLISQLVIRDFKIKYKRSVLGIFWSFLNPLLTMIVQYIVFSTMFRSEINNYAVYLLVGIICYSFFNEVTSMSLQSISGNANLIKKVYMPKYILPLSRTLSSSVNLLISLIPLLLISLITGVHFEKSIFLTIYFLLCLIVFALGVGMFLSALNVFFRDIQFLWTVIVMMWMYATPIFYSPSIIPEKFQFILNINPLYHFIKNIRMCIIDGTSPGPRSYAFCFGFALLSLLIGSFVFKKSQDKFTLYL